MDIKYRDCKMEDVDFIYNLKEKCLRWYVEKIYGWNEKEQYDLTIDEVKENIKDMKIIVYENKDIGTVTINIDEFQNVGFGLFCILPQYQNLGIGSIVLKDTIKKYKNKSIYLKTYKENPARFLYLRHGFKKIRESNTHWFMEYKE